MSRIWGLVTTEEGAPTEKWLALQSEAMCGRVQGSPELWHASRAGLGHHSVGAFERKVQPRMSADGRLAAAYCGKIFDYERLRGDLERAGTRFEPGDEDPEFLMQWVARHGFDRLAELNGLFACALWNEHEKRLDLITDRYGMRMIYYHHDEAKGRLIFATELRGVVDSGLVDLRINWPAWSTFLAFGHNLGDETAFRNVFTVPWGSVLTFINNTIHITKYWSPSGMRPDEAMTEQEAVEGLAYHFSRAMRRRNIPCRGRKAVFLSGGLDSRRIAAELHSQGAEFTTYTTGYRPGDEEGEVAARVAHVLGIPNTFVPLPKDFLTTYMPRGTELCGYETNLHQWIMPLVESLPSDVKVNYDGLDGDIPAQAVTIASGFRNIERFRTVMNATPEARARRVSGGPIDIGMFSTDVRRRLSNEHVVEEVAAELGKYESTENQLCLFYVLNRSRRGVSLNPFRLTLLKAESLCPFLDNDLFDFTLGIPAELRLEHSLRAEAVRAAYPEVGAILPAAKHADRKRSPSGADADSRAGKRRYLLHNIRQHYLGNRWLFETWWTVPALMKDYLKTLLLRHPVSRTFTITNVVFYLWMERYCGSLAACAMEGEP